jgi:hypothetical protein
MPEHAEITSARAMRRTEEGKPLVLNVVHKAEQNIVNRTSEDKVCLCPSASG